MNDRASFDVLVAPCVSGVIEAQRQAYAGMTRMETIMLAAGWNIALVAVFIRLIGIG
ncbi:hypothetical protein [Bradyrhizobium sp. Tv2a-2]|uniref:hypothetical protein n=1 Tax=Bradyrhizobium sp. Tv2a-2 TaxID=113395 RepID=UPI0012EB3E8C|nr:hypothetical protein [Bradyrhizobium sp. Tv2a-2]